MLTFPPIYSTPLQELRARADPIRSKAYAVLPMLTELSHTFYPIKQVTLKRRKGCMVCSRSVLRGAIGS